MDLLDKGGYFATRRRLRFRSTGTALDYEAIAAVLMTPDEQTPSELIDDPTTSTRWPMADAMDGLPEAAAGGA